MATRTAKVPKEPSSKDLDVKMAEFLGFSKAKYYKDGAGCYPEDATPIYGETCWSTTCKGGTYPMLSGDTVFRKKGAFGEHWAPTMDMNQAMEVVRKMLSENWLFEFHAEAPERCVAAFYMNRDERGWVAREIRSRDEAALAICKAAWLAIKKG